MRVWWQRCVFAALLNGVIWLTPLPIHFIALFLPFFSGYAIASGRSVKGWRASLEIGLVMGLTLGSTILLIGILAISVISLLQIWATETYLVVVIAFALAIGSYTSMAACIGALLAAHRANRSISQSVGRVYKP
jgi:uncharacterized membrane protein YGL010W